jgi:hypothetical protein
LNPIDTKYAIALKEEGFIIWKFKRKWKITARINSAFNQIIIEVKTIN